MIDYLLYAAALIGVAAAAFIVARSPAFWFGLAKVATMALLPFAMKRKPPDEEALWREAVLRGEDPGIRRGSGPSSK